MNIITLLKTIVVDVYRCWFLLKVKTHLLGIAVDVFKVCHVYQ